MLRSGQTIVTLRMLAVLVAVLIFVLPVLAPRLTTFRMT